MVAKAHKLHLTAGWYLNNCHCHEPQQSEEFTDKIYRASVKMLADQQWDGVKLCPHKPTTPEAMLAMTELYDHRGDTAMFDLDVAEYKNVAAENPAVVAQMRAALETYVVYC